MSGFYQPNPALVPRRQTSQPVGPVSPDAMLLLSPLSPLPAAVHYHFLLALPLRQTSYPPRSMCSMAPSQAQHSALLTWTAAPAPVPALPCFISGGSPMPIGQVPLALLACLSSCAPFPMVQTMALCLRTGSSLPQECPFPWTLPKNI